MLRYFHQVFVVNKTWFANQYIFQLLCFRRYLHAPSWSPINRKYSYKYAMFICGYLQVIYNIYIICAQSLAPRSEEPSSTTIAA